MQTLKEKEIAIYAKANDFLQVKNIDDVAQLIQVKAESLLELIEKSDESYYKFRIPKKRGGYREIDSPNGNLKSIQRRINYLLSVIYSGMKPPCVHGFVKTVTEQNQSFNIVSNAGIHVGAQYVLNMDIKDFFHSVDIWRVKRVFMSYPFFFENDMAAFLALLTTYQERLPMGAPTSPTISNLACFLFDRRMMRFAEDQELRFTRYADDLTFSSNRKITQTIIDAATQIIKEYGFAINEKKTRIFRGGGSQVVTGLKVNERVNVDRTYIRNIRAMLHNGATHGLLKASERYKNPQQFLNVLKGKLDFLSMVRGKEDAIYMKFHAKFWHLQHLQD